MYSFRGIYITSKIQYALRWRKLAEQGVPLTCSWIWMNLDPNNPEEMAWAWEQMIKDCARSPVLIIYRRRKSEKLKGGLAEIGAVLGHGGKVFCVGEPPDLSEGNRDYGEAITRFPTMRAAIRAAKKVLASEKEAVK